MATNLSLAEGEVGVGTFSITCPAIIQCFAIVGKRGSALIGTHVTPGSTDEQIKATFEYLKSIGGDDVHYWYILGPKQTHFSYSRVWKSDKAIKKTFKDTFGSSNATLTFLDAADELTTIVTDPRYNADFKTSAIDVRATLSTGGIKFEHRFRVSPRTHVDGWHEFDLTKFNPM